MPKRPLPLIARSPTQSTIYPIAPATFIHPLPIIAQLTVRPVAGPLAHLTIHLVLRKPPVTLLPATNPGGLTRPITGGTVIGVLDVVREPGILHFLRISKVLVMVG